MIQYLLDERELNALWFLNAGLANTGGAVETEDLALGRASELADSDELLQAEAPMRLQSLAAFLQSKGCA